MFDFVLCPHIFCCSVQFFPLRWAKHSNSKDLGKWRTILSTNNHEKSDSACVLLKPNSQTNISAWLASGGASSHLWKKGRVCSECSALGVSAEIKYLPPNPARHHGRAQGAINFFPGWVDSSEAWSKSLNSQSHTTRLYKEHSQENYRLPSS